MIHLHNTTILLCCLHASETWTVTKTDEKRGDQVNNIVRPRADHKNYKMKGNAETREELCTFSLNKT